MFSASLRPFSSYTQHHAVMLHKWLKREVTEIIRILESISRHLKLRKLPDDA